MKTYGRIDWMPRLNVWRVIWYVGSKDVASGDYPTQEEASQALQTKIREANPRRETMEANQVVEVQSLRCGTPFESITGACWVRKEATGRGTIRIVPHGRGGEPDVMTPRALVRPI